MRYFNAFVIASVIFVSSCSPPEKKLGLSNIDTTGWSEYLNEKYSYSFLYPSDYEILSNSQEIVFLKRKDDTWLIEISVNLPDQDTKKAKDWDFKYFVLDNILLKTGHEQYSDTIGSVLTKKIITEHGLKGYSINIDEPNINSDEKNRAVIDNRISCPVYAFDISQNNKRVIIFQTVYCRKIDEQEKGILDAVMNSLKLDN